MKDKRTKILDFRLVILPFIIKYRIIIENMEKIKIKNKIIIKNFGVKAATVSMQQPSSGKPESSITGIVDNIFSPFS